MVVLWTQKLLQHLVAAIAKRLIGGVLAIAEPNLLLFGQGEFPRPQTSTFMTAIAHGLLAGKSAGAPEVVPGIEFHSNGCFIIYFGKVTHKSTVRHPRVGFKDQNNGFRMH